MLRNRGAQNTKQKQLRQKANHAWSTGKPISTMGQNRKCLGHLPAGALSLRIATCCDCSSNQRNDLLTEIWINPSIPWSGQSENSQKKRHFYMWNPKQREVSNKRSVKNVACVASVCAQVRWGKGSFISFALAPLNFKMLATQVSIEVSFEW